MHLTLNTSFLSNYFNTELNLILYDQLMNVNKHLFKKKLNFPNFSYFLFYGLSRQPKHQMYKNK